MIFDVTGHVGVEHARVNDESALASVSSDKPGVCEKEPDPIILPCQRKPTKQISNSWKWLMIFIKMI